MSYDFLQKNDDSFVLSDHGVVVNGDILGYSTYSMIITDNQLSP